MMRLGMLFHFVFKAKYSMKFKRILEKIGFNVISAFNITDLNKERHLIDEVLIKIKRMIS